MKRLFAFLLVLVMILSVSLVACNKKPASTDDGDDDGWGNGGNNTTTTPDDDEGNDNGDVTPPPVNLTWTELEEKDQFTVYLTYPMYLRNSASDNDKSDTQLDWGKDVRVIATSNGEWYKIKYNNNTYYIYSYLTTKTQDSVLFDEENFTPIYSSVIDTVEGSGESTHFLRTTPCYDESGKYNEKINSLNARVSVKQSETANNTLQVIALSKNEVWAKVKCTVKGKEGTYYIKKSQLQEYRTDDSGNNNTPAA